MPNYTIDNKTFTEKQVTDQAVKLGVSLEDYLANTGLKVEATKVEESKSVNWFDQTWFGRGMKAASATGEATDLLLEFDDVNLKMVELILQQPNINLNLIELDPEDTDMPGKTALDLAREMGYTTVVKLIENHITHKK